MGMLNIKHWESRRLSEGHRTLVDCQELIAINKINRTQNYLNGIILSSPPLSESISYMSLCYFFRSFDFNPSKDSLTLQREEFNYSTDIVKESSC